LDNLESNVTPKNGEIIEDEDEEYDEEEYEEEDEEGEDPETRSAGESKKSNIVPSKIIAQRFSKHRANKKSFMSTAPLSAFIPKQPQGHHLGTIKPKLKVKETKSELKLYSEKLEEALAK